MAEAAGGKTFIQALHDKYTESEPLSCIIYVSKGAPGKTETGELLLPSQLTLNNCDISQSGDPVEIADLCRGVSELDLAENAIQEWEEVFTILRQMPKVNFLNVSSNPLRGSKVPEGKFTGLSKVVLNSLQMPWAQVWALLGCMPGCHELHLSLNKYDDFASPIDGTTYPNIINLLFNGNAITDWTEISKLGQTFPNLENLVMMESLVSSLPEPEENMGKDFQQLKAINISRTQIKDWAELEKFKHFPALCEVRLKGIKFLEEYSEKLRRQLVIGYLPNMTRINGSPVGEEERDDAERAFIRHYMDQDRRPARYQKLVSKHGELEQLAEVDLSAPSKVMLTITVGDRCFLHAFHFKWTLADIKRKLSELSGQAPDSFDVYYKDKALEGMQRMENPSKSLVSYNVHDGDELHVRKKGSPPPALFYGRMTWKPRALKN